jgi:hypothetical protein
LSKFSPRKTGKTGKLQKRYISTYDANIPASKLKDAGFIQDDGTILEYVARVEPRKIILEPKEDLFKKD